MGSAKDEMMRQEELQPMYEWIDDNFGDDAGEEGSEEWETAVKAFEDYCESLQRIEEQDYWQGQLEWLIYEQSQVGIFNSQMANIEELLNIEKTSNKAMFSLLVMLHGHVVASLEAYLAGTFIHKVTNSEILIRKLVETDPHFSNMKFTIKEIFEKKENLKFIVADYLQNLIFHDLKKVKPMFKDVLDCDFGNISWLFSAVLKRHDCVHRAGLDKDGISISLSADSIRELVNMSKQLVQKIEKSISLITE
ncbi:hypothetical protein [Aeromonas sp. 604534]|uniref:hypothetical protein n=1 Tax=Aeromonas sp. 604534 TaxID=2712055 RepID=UPI003BA046B2